MQLRFTKGVGVALPIAAGCAVLGFVMAPGWWAFAAIVSWLAFILALGGRLDSNVSSALIDDSHRNQSEEFVVNDLVYGTDPTMRGQAGSIFIDWDSLR